jgi:hypothetical protein
MSRRLASLRRRLGSGGRCFVAAGLLLAAAGAASAATTLVDIATETTDPSNLADTEPSIAVNPVDPAQIAVVAFSGNWAPGVMAPVWKSNDGGVTWRKVFQIPQPAPGLAARATRKSLSMPQAGSSSWSSVLPHGVTSFSGRPGLPTRR